MRLNCVKAWKAPTPGVYKINSDTVNAVGVSCASIIRDCGSFCNYPWASLGTGLFPASVESDALTVVNITLSDILIFA